MDDITPNNIIIIPIREKILVFDPESDPSFGLGAQVGGLGGTPVEEVKTAVDKVDNAINDNYNIITDLINANLDTSAKEILGDFTF
ncbi:unnamed protein product, partial [marine sediment metagenome]